MDHRLEKLKRAREAARERRDGFSILQLLISSLRGFLEFQLTLDQLEDSVEETSDTLVSLLEQLDLQPHASPLLIIHLESALECIETHLGAEVTTEKAAESALQGLLQVEQELKDFALGDFFAQAKQSRQKFDLTRKAMEQIDPRELELGHYDRVAGLLDDVFSGFVDVDFALRHLERLYEEMLEGLESYDASVIKPEEWTLEVALADEFMIEGYDFWLDALEQLCVLCVESSLTEDDVLEPLEQMRQGNRYWLTVERLSTP